MNFAQQKWGGSEAWRRTCRKRHQEQPGAMGDSRLTDRPRQEVVSDATYGSGAPFGHSSHIRPSWRMRPASRPGCVPKPQKKSARTGPRIAPPVSCASVSRVQRLGRQRPRGGEVHRRTERNEARVDGDRALGEQRHAERAERPVDRGVERARAAAAALRGRTRSSDSRRAARAPGPDCAFTHALIACIDARSRVSSPRSISTRADRAVRMAVLVGVVEAHHRAVGERDASRSLDLEEERFDRIGDVRERLAGEQRGIALDLRARPVRNDLPALDAAAHALVLELRMQLGQVDDEQIVGRRRTAGPRSPRSACASLSSSGS